MNETPKNKLNDHTHTFDPKTMRCSNCGLTKLELEGLPRGTWFQNRLASHAFRPCGSDDKGV